jgi:dihydroxyacetone kinase-like predicted kinase
VTRAARTPGFSASARDSAETIGQRLETEHCEILTIYFGHEVTAEAAHQLAQKIAEQYPKLEIDVLNGGQFHYSYLISLE